MGFLEVHLLVVLLLGIFLIFWQSAMPGPGQKKIKKNQVSTKNVLARHRDSYLEMHKCLSGVIGRPYLMVHYP